MWSEIEKFEKLVWEKDMKITDIQASEEAVWQTLESERQDRKELDMKHEQKLKALKQDNQNMTKDYKEKVKWAEDQENQMSMQLMTSQSEFETEKALLQQKINHIEVSLKAFEEKEATSSQENAKREHDF